MKDQMEGMLDSGPCLLLEASSTKPERVETDQPRAISRHHCERRRVHRELGAAGRHHRLTHANILMNSGVGPEDSEVFDVYMAAESAEGSDDRIRADLAVVTDMSVVHDEIVVAESSTASPLCRADMDRHVFPNDRPLADLETGRRQTSQARGPPIRSRRS